MQSASGMPHHAAVLQMTKAQEDKKSIDLMNVVKDSPAIS